MFPSGTSARSATSASVVLCTPCSWNSALALSTRRSRFPAVLVVTELVISLEDTSFVYVSQLANSLGGLHVDERRGSRGSSSTVLPGHPPGQADACLPLHGRVPRLRRRFDRQRRLADDPARPALLGTEPAMGAERLPAHLRRLHAARRPRRRPARPPPHPPRRHPRLRALLAHRRCPAGPGPARRRAARPGSWRRDDGAGRP